MVLDIDLFRVERDGDPEVIRKSQRDRYKNVELVNQVIELDKKWKSGKILILKFIYALCVLAKYNFDQFKRQKNLTSKAIGEKMKVGLVWSIF